MITGRSTMTATDPYRGRAVVSPTTSDVSNRRNTNGNERQHVTLPVADGGLHGASLTDTDQVSRRVTQRLSSHTTRTRSISATSANVTRDVGIPFIKRLPARAHRHGRLVHRDG